MTRDGKGLILLRSSRFAAELSSTVTRAVAVTAVWLSRLGGHFARADWQFSRSTLSRDLPTRLSVPPENSTIIARAHRR